MKDKEVWVLEASMTHENKNLVFSHVRKTLDFKEMGLIEAVCDTLEDAVVFQAALGEEYGVTTIVEGFDPTPQIGGVYAE